MLSTWICNTACAHVFINFVTYIAMYMLNKYINGFSQFSSQTGLPTGATVAFALGPLVGGPRGQERGPIAILSILDHTYNKNIQKCKSFQ